VSAPLDIAIRKITDAEREELRGLIASTGNDREVLYLALGAAGLTVFAWLAQRTDMMWTTTIASLLAFGYVVFARRLRRRRAVESTAWEKIREIRIRPRELVVVNDWMIFVTEGAQSFLTTSEELRGTPEQAARAELVMRQLWPNGAFLQTALAGEKIPLRTEAGDSWRPPDDFDEAEGVLATAMTPRAR
jgi:hypothetical protein